MEQNNHLNFKMKVAEWRGYVKRALEDLNNEMQSIQKKLDKVDNNVNGLYMKVAALGGTVAIITSLIFWAIFKR